ncbi:MAG: hypothetical protein A3D44_00285 [Candidatus Staskawiczbacteria bacterium RIFCSPHIGHO2_02_FULL_42_22]|uniref:Uncharacterized protein n=1 Tax=Candidatus Staskawiczbacteria bacterium RIFCSPHIGHO2_02_FULL_42_22 TaxID=1802207 RepID=A0A1G2I4L6_9BACT|nr:MAG: hypothetical protein A3D44_00285 [Candidatus Staskawiczbacteria bacterium RIFCSPHIGHO2_02_FULL_42_22]
MTLVLFFDISELHLDCLLIPVRESGQGAQYFHEEFFMRNFEASSNARSQAVAGALSELSEMERAELKDAAGGFWEGGEPVSEPLRAKVAKLELVYRGSGRLRPDVYKMLRGDDGSVLKKPSWLL